MSIFDKQEIDLPCPKCNKKYKKTISWVKQNKKLDCSCGTEISLQTKDFKKDLAEVKKSLKDFESMFKQLKYIKYVKRQLNNRMCKNTLCWLTKAHRLFIATLGVNRNKHVSIRRSI